MTVNPTAVAVIDTLLDLTGLPVRVETFDGTTGVHVDTAPARFLLAADSHELEGLPTADHVTVAVLDECYGDEPGDVWQEVRGYAYDGPADLPAVADAVRAYLATGEYRRA